MIKAQLRQNQKQSKPYSILEEPAEVIKTAREQIFGKIQEEQPTQKMQQPQQAVKPAPDEAMRTTRIQALEQELKEIRNLKKQQEMQKMMQEEQGKRQEEQRKQEEKQLLVEPSTKPKRGFFAGLLGFLRRKQRTTEYGKIPTS